MLWIIAIIFVLVGAVALFTAYTVGGYLYVVLGVAAVVLIVGAFGAGKRVRRQRTTARSGPP